MEKELDPSAKTPSGGDDAAFGARALLGRCLRNPENLRADTTLRADVMAFLGPAGVKAWLDDAPAARPRAPEPKAKGPKSSPPPAEPLARSTP